MKINHRIICGALLAAALLAGCDTSSQPATPVTPPPTNVMTSVPIQSTDTSYPPPNSYPAPATLDATAAPAPTAAP